MGISENAEIAYTFANASFHDKSRDVHMNLGGSGRALLKCEVPSGDGEEYVKKFLGTATEKAVSSMATSCAGYEQLVLHVNELADMVRKVMSDENAALAEQVKTISVTGIWPDENSIKKIKESRTKKQESAQNKPKINMAAQTAYKPGNGTDGASVRPKFCYACGANLSDRTGNLKFCPLCGANLNMNN